MNRKQKILELQRRLNAIKAERLPLPEYVNLQLRDEQASAVTRAEVSPSGKAMQRIAQDLNKIQTSPHVKNLFKLLRKAEYQTNEKFEGVSRETDEKMQALYEELRASDAKGTTNEAFLIELQSRFERYISEFDQAKGESETNTVLLKEETTRVEDSLRKIEEGMNLALLEGASETVIVSETASNALKTALEASAPGKQALEDIKRLERDLLNRINAIAGAGNANRSIVIAGNANTLQYYTDINLKAGTGVTITYTPNHATQYTDVTISSNGGGSGITREINSVAVPTVMGGTPGIDYVYLVSGNTTVTLPTAVGNENLYTVKNVGNGIVVVNTTGGETIDDAATADMPVKYTSIDLISNGTAWKIT